MCIRIVLPASVEHVIEAQWALVDALAQAFSSDERHVKARRSLSEALRVARARTNSPQQWANAFAQALIEIVSTLQAAVRITPDAATKIAQLESNREYLLSIIRARNDNQNQIESLTKKHDDLLQRSVQLEKALELARDEYHRDVSDLQATIADLNRIIADQQERLGALR